MSKDEKFRDKVICISSTEEPIKTNKTMVTSMMMVQVLLVYMQHLM